MYSELFEAAKTATPEKFALALGAGIEAAYVSGPQFGYAAALEVLERDEPVAEPVAEPSEPQA